MKTSELTGCALIWAVAKCEGAETLNDYYQITLVGDDEPYHPSTDWGVGGPIIEREAMVIAPYGTTSEPWEAWMGGDLADVRWRGATPLIAAMRCYVASKLGDEIDVPEELTCA